MADEQRRGCVPDVLAELSDIKLEQRAASVERDGLVKTVDRLEAVVDELRADVKQLLATHNIGRGVAIALTKFGVVIVALIGGAAWLYEHWKEIFGK